MEKKNKEFLKLSKLLIHWAEHNDSHKESFSKWQDVARENGLNNIVLYLEKAKEMLDESSKYLLKAHEELG
ncbi:MAG: hypothetical protein JW891_11285 [Candidatus Lokiarchaeota archaeon]|nr:hypothetical protein [Candidatus Lokiarchaeota archaeon]